MVNESNDNTPQKRAAQAKKKRVKKSTQSASATKAASKAETNPQAQVRSDAAAAEAKATETAKASQSKRASKAQDGQTSQPENATERADKESNQTPAPMQSHVAPAEHTPQRGGNGIAWLALLCGLGGLAAGGYVYHQSTLGQQSAGAKLVDIEKQVSTLAGEQNKVSEAIDAVAERVQTAQSNFTAVQNSATTNEQAIKALESRNPAALAQQVKALDDHLASLQQKSSDEMSQLSAQIGASVTQWRQQEFAFVLASIEQHLNWTGDTGRAAAGLQMINTQVAGLEEQKYQAFSTQALADIAALEAVSSVDRDALYQQLSALIGQVEPLTFSQDSALRAQKSEQKASTDKAIAGAEESMATQSGESTAGKLKAVGKRLFADIGSMVKIQNIDKTPVASLDTKSKFVVQESLRLNLKVAQLALIDENESLFSAEIGSAKATLSQYFDQASEPVKAWVTQLDAIANTQIVTSVPDISGTRIAFEKAVSAGE